MVIIKLKALDLGTESISLICQEVLNQEVLYYKSFPYALIVGVLRSVKGS